ncbi:unnamed protein product [Ceutorhynchus assimilis]|uniref:Uncharacterized protein n=1 Tax=Ceutorhynchus assimilis TaxID=467358 RepID=A0A9N9QJC7_9CUCU|nr:unnamed protein product [Ceutorhynchus assimilis]
MDNFSNYSDEGQTEGQTFADFVNETTTAANMSLGEVIEAESHQVMTVVLFVISAVMFIVLIFISAVFMDCRQQRINNTQPRRFQRARRRFHRTFPSLPKIGDTARKGDEDAIVENMEPTSSTATVGKMEPSTSTAVEMGEPSSV